MRTFLMGKVGFVEKKVWEPNCWINVVSPTQDDLRYLIDEIRKLLLMTLKTWTSVPVWK